MDSVTLAVAARTTQTPARILRREGKVPGVIYGNTDNTLIAVGEMDLLRAYRKAGESTLVEIDLEGRTLPVLFHALELDPVTDRLTHVDFYAVDMKKEVEAEVQIRHEGEAPAVKNLGAILVTPLDTVTVRALPAKLPHDLELDMTKLEELDGTLTVADLKAPEGVTILNDPDEVLVIAQEPREEEPEPQPVAAAEGEAAAADGAAGEGEKKEEDKKE